jgi:spermidine synthase
MPRPDTLATAFAAFAAGWSVMALEMLDGRLMAPVFGQTLFQWGAIIGTALFFMSLGYWAGGRLGGGRHARAALPALLGFAALCAALTPWIGRGIAAAAEAGLGPVAGAVGTSAVLIGPPAFCLAAVSPLCVARLAERGGAGPASGAISACQALGSIGGTFFAAFFAVPVMGLVAGYASAAALAALAALATGLAPWRAALVLLPLLPGLLSEQARAARFAHYDETPYNTIMVWEDAAARYLMLNSPLAVQSMQRRDGTLPGSYWELLGATPALADGRRALFLGVAGGSAIAAMQRAFPDLRGEGVELDPEVTAVARRDFGLSIPVRHDDARRAIEQAGSEYDLIVSDLYATAQIPPHAATVEFFAAAARRLAPGGVLALNVFNTGDAGGIVGPLAATLRAVFPAVLAARSDSGNTLLFATREGLTRETAQARLAAVPALAQAAAGRLRARLEDAEPLLAGFTPLTDNRSDLEWRSARMLAAWRERQR